MKGESKLQARSFGWTARITEQMEEMPDEVAAEYCMVVVMYGSYGIEPEGRSWPVMAAFRGIKGDSITQLPTASAVKKAADQKKLRRLKPPTKQVLTKVNKAKTA